MTLEEWSRLPEDESGELVDGRLVEEEMTDYVHEVIVSWLIATLRAWLAPQGGFVGGSDARFAVASTRGRKPDVTAYLPPRRPPGRGLIRIPPDIAVEVVSAAPTDVRRDRIEKMVEYARFGVRFYWIVDPPAHTLEIYELQADGRYARAAGASAGVLADVPGCGGLSLDLDTVWAEVDRLLDEDPSSA